MHLALYQQEGEDNKMNKIISAESVKALMNYLATRPYQEVFQVMPILASLPDAPPVIPEIEKPATDA